VLKDGHVIFERYYDGFQPRDTHTWASMSKSVVGVIALRLAKKGVVDLAAPVSRYVPELAGSPFGTATLQQNLDMHVSATYPKDLPPDRGMFAAAGVTPAPPGAPTTIHDFLRVVLPGSEPSGVNFYYQNGSTEAVAWALERASGQTLPDLVRQYVWTPMGASEDGYYLLDRSRTAFASGGLFSTLRDLARFGEFIRQGLANDGDAAVGQRLLSWSQATPSTSSRLKYRDFWWHDQRAAFAIGRYGQRLAVIPDKHLVIAQFGAYEDNRPRATTTAEGAANHSPDLRDSEAFEALALAIADRL
jgi:CubicO group peptidase (beta-lactamase class C family)